MPDINAFAQPALSVRSRLCAAACDLQPSQVAHCLGWQAAKGNVLWQLQCFEARA